MARLKIVMRAMVLLSGLAMGCSGAQPCTVEPGGIDFGEVEVTTGRSGAKRVKLRNPSSGERVCVLAPVSDQFTTDLSGEIRIPPFSSRDLMAFFAPADGRLHQGSLEFHSSDGGCEVSVQLKGLGSGQLEMDTQPLEFVLAPGEEESREVFIRNSRRTPTAISVGVTPGAPDVFSVTPTDVEVPAFGSVAVTVKAKARLWAQEQTALIVSSRTQQLNRLLAVTPSSPTLEISPLAFTLRRVGVRHFAERTFVISNAGKPSGGAAQALSIMGVQLTGGDPREASILPLERSYLSEGQSVELNVRVDVAQPGPRTFAFFINSVPGFTGPREVTLSTIAEVLPPCSMQVEPASPLQLQEVSDGGVEGRVTFTNIGTSFCVVDNLRLSAFASPGYTPSGATQVEVAAGSSHVVTIAGPRLQTQSGKIGELRFHIFRDGGVDEGIELRSPP